MYYHQLFTHIPAEEPKLLGQFINESFYMHVHVYILMFMHTDISDLQKVQELLADVKGEWHPLGLALGLKQPALQEIKQNNLDVENCKREMVTQWLNQVDNVKPTYASLEAALRNVTVKCVAVANFVHKYYAQPK